LAELCYGAENSRRRAENLDGVEQLTARLAVLDFDKAAAAEYGRVRAPLKSKPIGPLDMMIAAHAISRGLVVITNDRGDFSRIRGLHAEGWFP
jgi:tRNA(fMet)-specific endonuclease VapC